MSHVTPVLLVHGGAGNPAAGAQIDEARHHEALRVALEAGWSVLAAGGAALDAAQAAVESLEDCPLFNAGRGAVPTTSGRVELDAAVMDGARGDAGAVAGVACVRHPVALARHVMERTPHVLVVGAGGERLAEEAGLERPDPSWFAGAADDATLDAPDRGDALRAVDAGEHGTVGAVALDSGGRLAAATSTGGVRGQLPGRVGDSPVIGAGTWADTRVAVSCTGAGEHFIRIAAAHELAARVGHAGAALAHAAPAVVELLGGSGGLIALGADGSWAMPFNTALMFRGQISPDGARTWIWSDEEETDG